jgi:hypothetical protein
VLRFWISGGQIDNGAIYFARTIVAVERYMSPQVFNDAPRCANPICPRYSSDADFLIISIRATSWKNAICIQLGWLIWHNFLRREVLN